MILPRSIISLPDAAETGTLQQIKNTTREHMHVIASGKMLFDLRPQERVLCFKALGGWAVNWEATLLAWVNEDGRTAASAIQKAGRHGLDRRKAEDLLAMESLL